MVLPIGLLRKVGNRKSQKKLNEALTSFFYAKNLVTSTKPGFNTFFLFLNFQVFTFAEWFCNKSQTTV